MKLVVCFWRRELGAVGCHLLLVKKKVVVREVDEGGVEECLESGKSFLVLVLFKVCPGSPVFDFGKDILNAKKIKACFFLMSHI